MSSLPIFRSDPTLLDSLHMEHIEKTLDAELLPASIRLINLEYAHRLLVYVLRRPDNDFKAPLLEPLLRQARRCKPEFLKDFYAALSPVYQALAQYIRLEESCIYSGKYRADLDVARKRVGTLIALFETVDEDGRNDEVTRLTHLLQ